MGRVAYYSITLSGLVLGLLCMVDNSGSNLSSPSFDEGGEDVTDP